MPERRSSKELLVYTLSMLRCFILAGVLLFTPQVTLSIPHHPPPPSDQPLPLGSLIEQVICVQHPDQSYALYLPSNYSPARFWPIVYSFDPAARGKIPVELQKAAAERYGYILASSNNSRNGPWKGEAEAAEAMMDDTQARFSIDPHRVYFAGFSGGARLASQLATLCKCAAGLFLNGAGFSSGHEPNKDLSFAVFSAVGTLDFNFRELIPLQVKLALAGYPHWLRTFAGPHEWASSETMDEALAWFRVQAIKSKLTPSDNPFIRDQFTKSRARADSFAQRLEVLDAFREYAQIAATYEGLVDLSAVRAKADALNKEKPLKEAIKQEARDFEEQDRLTAGISAALSAPAPSDSPTTSASAEDQVQSLRDRAEHEKHPQRAVVLKRALSGIFIEAMELGNEALERKNFTISIRAYRSATGADPQSAWAWQSLAIAQATAGARRETFTALQHARELTTDKARFADWLKHEPAFDRYRSTSEFQNLQ